MSGASSQYEPGLNMARAAIVKLLESYDALKFDYISPRSALVESIWVIDTFLGKEKRPNPEPKQSEGPQITEHDPLCNALNKSLISPVICSCCQLIRTVREDMKKQYDQT